MVCRLFLTQKIKYCLDHSPKKKILYFFEFSQCFRVVATSPSHCENCTCDNFCDVKADTLSASPIVATCQHRVRRLPDVLRTFYNSITWHNPTGQWYDRDIILHLIKEHFRFWLLWEGWLKIKFRFETIIRMSGKGIG